MSKADKFNLKGKSALVTGASSGLGRHFADLLSSFGASVALCARRMDRLEQAVSEIEKNGGRALALEVDVTRETDVTNAFDRAAREFGGIDIVVNNAGITMAKWFVDVEAEEWRRMMDVNLDGVFRVGQLAARQMISQGRGGSIINIASVGGLAPVGLLSAYSTSKAAVIQLTKSMALELSRHNIRVNALAPGYITTDLNRDFLTSAQGEKLLSKIPFRRAGLIDELDGPLMLLASDAGSFMTGTILVVDGGALLSTG